MSKSETEIKVRSLDGASANISISPSCDIGDLKALLKESFPPAKRSPNFHLFFKGDKLKAEDRISSLHVSDDEFLVLVPFSKKNRQSELPISPQPSECPRPTAESSYADSAWHDIMQDFSCLSDLLPEDPTPSLSAPLSDNREEFSTDEGPACHSSVAKRPKRESATRRILLDIIGSKDTEPEILQKLQPFLCSVGCLSDCRTSSCLLFKEVCGNSEGTKGCLCPSWLKRLVKCFAFLNMFYGLCQRQRSHLTWEGVKETLSVRDAFPMEDVGISDVEQLLILCPEAVMLVKQGNAIAKSTDAVILRDFPIEFEQCRSTSNKQLSSLSVVIAVEKREYKFKSTLWKAIKYAMGRRAPGNDGLFSLSLDDLLSIKRGSSEGSKVNLKRSRSSTRHCCDTNLLQPEEMVEHLRVSFGNHGQIVHVEQIDAKLAVYSDIPGGLSEVTKAVLKDLGISMLYSHQAEAIQASCSGKNVVIATSTSSGKSMCYNLPVIEEMTRNLLSCAIYLFPTKALAQDQLRSLLDMTSGLSIKLNVGVYDGDTSQEQRTWLRDNARLLITNPDMLHMSILPLHGQFQRILSNLRFVVIDEAHMYKGAFGCHSALILRRLRRICSHLYGSNPSFIFCTATSANPREHAMELANLQNIELIQNDGSPSGPKLFLLWNPAPCLPNGLVIQSGSNIGNSADLVAFRRSSPILETSCLFAEMVQHGLRCIAFCKTRKVCELVLRYTREILQETAPELLDSVSSYRAGYTVQDRRRIEAELFGGKLRGVAATNALELGIDIGHTDATLHLGFPGSIASLWQQAGRSGRRSKPSLAIYIAFNGPLDQYFMKFPQKIFKGQIECCQVDAHNQQVLEEHLACAAVEHPLSMIYDEKYFGSGLNNAIMTLKKKGYLCGDPCSVSSSKLLAYIGPQKNPSHAISIRAIETNKYKVVDMLKNEVIEEIEESRAFFQVYDGAVYMNQGITYLVKSLDLSERIAHCQRSDLKYYTKTRDYTDIHVIGGDFAFPPISDAQVQYLRTTAQVHRCKVTTCWFGFYRIWCGSNRVFDRVDLNLPTYSYESQAVWIRVPDPVKLAVEVEKLNFRAGQHAASHALFNVVPLYLMCNPSDLSVECANPFETRKIPERILLYDQTPGGIGVSVQVQPLFNELLIAALELVTACNCSSNVGCPNCIQTLSCHEFNEALDKKAAIIILKGVIEAERTFFGDKK